MRAFKKVSTWNLILLLMFFCWGTTASAVPLLNEYLTDDGSAYYDTFDDGSSFGYYTNSGELLFTEAGNNLGSPDTLASVEDMVREELDYGSDFYLTRTGTVQFDAYDNNTGTWETLTPSEGISLYAVKAGNAFAMYLVNPADTTGSWSTYDIWISGLQGTGGNDGLEISTFTGYNPAPVPEPATILLLGTGLAGFIGFNRKKLKRE